MSLSVTVTVTGDQQTIRNLQKLGSDFKNFSGAMKTIGGEVSNYFSGPAFASQGGVYGKAWASLSPTYARWKSKNYPGRGINVRTGKTQRSFTSKATQNSALIYNSNTNVFDFLQLGTRNMPSRPMVGVNSDVKGIVQRIIQADVTRKIQAAGG